MKTKGGRVTLKLVAIFVGAIAVLGLLFMFWTLSGARKVPTGLHGGAYVGPEWVSADQIAFIFRPRGLSGANVYVSTLESGRSELLSAELSDTVDSSGWKIRASRAGLIWIAHQTSKRDWLNNLFVFDGPTGSGRHVGQIVGGISDVCPHPYDANLAVVAANVYSASSESKKWTHKTYIVSSSSREWQEVPVQLPISYCSWSPDGERLAVLFDQTIGLLEWETGRVQALRHFDDERIAFFPRLNWSPDGRWLVFSYTLHPGSAWDLLWGLLLGQTRVYALNVDNPNVLLKLYGGEFLQSTTLSPDGRHLLGTNVDDIFLIPLRRKPWK